MWGRRAACLFHDDDRRGRLPHTLRPHVLLPYIMPQPTLYLVATPVGNLGDISVRALEILKSVDVIAAEDTRHTRKLSSHFGIKTQLISYHEHSGPAATDAIVRRMVERGESVALVTDAGTPGISDPGVDLVRAAIDANVTVVPIPGPVAAILALIGSGLPSARFLFEGFLPRTRSTRLQRLNALKAQERTLIFYESPQRVGATLAEMANVFGETRAACVARELTKLHEEFRRGTLSELADFYAADETRGECVIVVGGFDADDAPAVVVVDDGEAEPAHGKDLIRQLAEELGVGRRDLYQLVLGLKNRG